MSAGTNDRLSAVRRAGPRDAEAIAGIQVHTWRVTYRDLLPQEVLADLSFTRSVRMWTRLLSLPQRQESTFVAERTGAVVGFASCGPTRGAVPGYPGEVYALYIAPPAQRLGLGRQLLEAAFYSLACRGHGDVVVWALEGNRPARRFYERCGGVLLPRRTVFSYNGRTYPTIFEIAYGWPEPATAFTPKVLQQ
jgi:GNAT superfamily N-acetyltransferase